MAEDREDRDGLPEVDGRLLALAHRLELAAEHFEPATLRTAAAVVRQHALRELEGRLEDLSVDGELALEDALARWARSAEAPGDA